MVDQYASLSKAIKQKLMGRNSSRHGRLRLSRTHLSIAAVAFFGLTILFRTRPGIPAGIPIQVPTDMQITPTVTVATADWTNVTQTASQAPPPTTQPSAFGQMEIRNLIRTQGTFIPIEVSRTLSSDFEISNETIAETLDVLDGKIEEERKSMMADDPSWNTTHPKQLLIVTSWRSGSTFLGTILAHHPAVFYHYEPLMYVGTHQIRDGKPAALAVSHLRNLFHCDYSNAHYIRAIKDNIKGLLGPNRRLWDSCAQVNVKTCAKSRFLRQACAKFPFLVSKVVRLRLALARHLLADPQLQRMKIVFLVRDPRATINSRIGVSYWCGKSEDCINPRRLCQDLQSDLEAFQVLNRTYSDRLMMVQYETLAQKPHQTLGEIFRFADLSFLPSIRETIRQHTSRNQGNAWATYRKSSERVDLWRKQMSANRIVQVQDACLPVLNRLNCSLV